MILVPSILVTNLDSSTSYVMRDVMFLRKPHSPQSFRWIFKNPKYFRFGSWLLGFFWKMDVFSAARTYVTVSSEGKEDEVKSDDAELRRFVFDKEFLHHLVMQFSEI